MFVELHMIQNFAPSCLNRDDTNSPKDCEFGGFRRARISSQCLKRSIRTSPVFRETVETGLGVKTKRLAISLIAHLAASGREYAECEKVVRDVLEPAFGSLKKESKIAYLLYLNERDEAWVAEQIVDQWDTLTGSRGPRDKAVRAISSGLKEALQQKPYPPDMALFGRMIANAPETSVTAACQVAHALSTHRVCMEMDYYTAVDDLKPDDAPGADMMGTVEFNSSCFYRYALIDTEQLTANLGDDTALARRTVEGFLRAAVAAIPTGKQNSMAAQNRPSLLLGVVRDGGCPASLTNAFEEPVWVREHSAGLVAQSVSRLLQYWDQLAAAYGTEGVRATALLTLNEPEGGNFGTLGGARVGSFEDFLAVVCAALPEGA